MRKFGIFIGIILYSCNLLAITIEEEKFYGPKKNEPDLNILSSTDINIFDQVMTTYADQNQDLFIRYVVASSKDIYNEIKSENESYDVVMSSAMDLQMKLANDGYAETYDSLNTSNVPEWANWQNKLYGFALEPIIIVVSKELFSNIETPSNRRELINLLKNNPNAFNKKVITYDINTSGAGYLFATQDERESDTFWRLKEVIGTLNASLSCCSGDMLDNIENNKAAIAYNVLGSYAEKRAENSNNIVVIYPEDYTHVLLRTAFIPKNSNKINLAGEFLDYILSEKGQLIMESKGGLPSLANKNIQNQLNAKPIRLDIGLLVYLDDFKKYNFLKEWNDALKYKD